ADSELRARLGDLAVRPLPAGQECSTLKLAKHVGHCWTEAWRAGAARQEETAKLKETRSRLESQLLNAKADMELETQSLARAEEELQRLVADHRARERIVKEEFAVARATNSLLMEVPIRVVRETDATNSSAALPPSAVNNSQSCSIFSKTAAGKRPVPMHRMVHMLRMLSMLRKGEALRHVTAPESVELLGLAGFFGRQALQAAERENELQATIAALENDKARLIQDQARASFKHRSEQVSVAARRRRSPRMRVSLRLKLLGRKSSSGACELESSRGLDSACCLYTQNTGGTSC
ncbi:CPK16, partial [Symbiodinium necroappetens]